MKPRIFIGSSKEALDVAYAIQDNLQHDATVTVWTQGIFGLSSNALDDLIKLLNQIDFGIFVFQPDDILQMRNIQLESVRDNVVFELGLFIGRLGKERIYFVMPQNATNLRLPTDLLGMTPGRYDERREDGNLWAALGPFCNQVRKNLKTFLIENLVDLANESAIAKKIAMEKSDHWEWYLAAELLKPRMAEIIRGYLELEKGLVFKQSENYSSSQFIAWLNNKIDDIVRILEIIEKSFKVELINSLDSSESGGNIFEIKQAVDKIVSMCKELLALEYEILGVKPPDEFTEVPIIMRSWTKFIIDEINSFPSLIETTFSAEKPLQGEIRKIKLNFESPILTEKLSKIKAIVSNNRSISHS